MHERHPAADVIMPPRADAVPSGTALTAPSQRDRHIQAIAVAVLNRMLDLGRPNSVRSA